MTSPSPTLEETVQRLCAQLASTAIERDRRGGLPQAERALLRASGLLRLTAPTAFGGWGRPMSVMLQVVRELARVDPSLAHVFGFHHLMLASVRLYGHEAQWSKVYREVVEQDLFWGNALNPKDARTRLLVREGRLSIEGTKSFCSGAGDSDRLIVSALHEETHKLVVAMVPTRREGIRILGDWDAIGQRQTDSGTVELNDVEIDEQEILRTPGPLGSTFASLRSCIAQSILVNVYLGIAEGAFHEVRHAISARSSHAPDATILQLRAGELYVQLEGASALARDARAALDEAWQRGEALTEAERATVAVRIALAKVATTRAGLEITSRIFELIGARAAAGSSALDRYFRNLRVHTLHDSVDEKLRELGAFALEDSAPKPGFYS